VIRHDARGGGLSDLVRAHLDYREKVSAIERAYDLALRLQSDWGRDPLVPSISALMECYARYVALTARELDADRDALIAIGSRLFHVRRRVLRCDVERAMQARS